MTEGTAFFLACFGHVDLDKVVNMALLYRGIEERPHYRGTHYRNVHLELIAFRERNPWIKPRLAHATPSVNPGWIIDEERATVITPITPHDGGRGGGGGV